MTPLEAALVQLRRELLQDPRCGSQCLSRQLEELEEQTEDRVVSGENCAAHRTFLRALVGRSAQEGQGVVPALPHPSWKAWEPSEEERALLARLDALVAAHTPETP